MSLAPGTRLGPYEILAPLGKGGMGEVYRARDTRLGREVAVKVSAEQFSERFQREARAIAALNHPNICHLYDIGPNYLVMELIEGPTLAEKLKEGPLPFDEAITIARQIADGVEAAHEKGIIHRDLKPGNVKIKPDGTVKVLDFGLAKLGGMPTFTASDESPTLTMHDTQAGVILGTASYMSPEQARGKDVDKRADIFSFGAVLYEMLTGKRLFQGETVSELLAAVIKEQPDLSAAPASTRRLLRRCLEKDPKNRLRDIGDAGVDLKEILEGRGEEASASNVAVVAPPARQGMPRWVWGVAALLVVAGAAGVAWTMLKPKAEQPILQMEINPPEGVKFLPGLTPFALSPDGRHIVYVGTDQDGKQMLWLRAIDSTASNALAGTENAEIPFWSPDSRWVGFSANGKLQKVDTVGSNPPQIICEIDGRAGGTWNKDGVIVFDQGDKPLLRVSANGGTPVPILQLDAKRAEQYQGAPYFLPDGRHLLYYSANKNGADLMVASVDGKVNRLLIERVGAAAYGTVPSGGGAVLYGERGQLMARPFDPDKLDFTGPAIALADDVFFARWWYASSTGLLAYRHMHGTQRQLVWYSRDGKPAGILEKPGAISSPRISPDQKSVLFGRNGDGRRDLWTVDIARNTSSRLTFGPAFTYGGIWSSDGKGILYASSPEGTATALVQRPAGGVGGEQTIVPLGGNLTLPTFASRDGHWLAHIGGSALNSVIGLRSLDDPKKVILVRDHDREMDASISPDGRWLLYSSVPGGRREVYVQSVPKEVSGSAGAPGKWQISKDGGAQPAWRGDGKEIFFVAPDGTMMAAPVSASPDSFQPEEPKPLFKAGIEFDPAHANVSGVREYDVTPDGQRFLLNQHVADTNDAPINIVVNWPKLLAR